MLTMIENRASTDSEWDILWRTCPYATYYHSREWAEIWRLYTNGVIEPAPVTITFSDGAKVLLPFMRKKYMNGLIVRYALCGPPFISKYGNWLSKDLVTDEHVALISRYIFENYTNVTWQLNPFDIHSKKVQPISKVCMRHPEIDYAINLAKGEDAVYSSFKSSCRNHIKQAIRYKLQVQEENSVDAWKRYYEIYQDTVRRWGREVPYVLRWKLFELLYKGNSPHVKLWLVWYEDTAIAGCVNFYSNGKIMAWHMSSLTDFRKYRPVHFLEYSMILHGIQSGYSWYDMGSDGGVKGLQDFKRSFGPDKLMCDKLVMWQPIIRNVLRVRNGLRALRIRYARKF